MKTGLIIATSLLGIPASLALAETIVVGDQVAVRRPTLEVPPRGMRMHGVEARFGAPQERHAPVGKPPITRWDYPGFSVYFEYDHVVHAVVHAAAAASASGP
ncbi:MAG: hypothetical protein RLZZ393_2185 [Pseudomonadota bacterium]|jgi:hypothetical protein